MWLKGNKQQEIKVIVCFMKNYKLHINPLFSEWETWIITEQSLQTAHLWTASPIQIQHKASTKPKWNHQNKTTIHPSTIHPSIIQPLICILSPYFWLSAKLRCSQTFVFNEESAFQSSNQNQAMTVHFIFEFITDWPLEEFYRTHTQGQKSEEKNCRIQNSPNTSWLTV